MDINEIQQAYDVLAQGLRDYTASEAAKVGNSQRSIGGLAEVVANPSGQTSNLANYTYNRVFRPTVDTAVAQLLTQGKTEALSKLLDDKLRAAKNNYENAKNNYTVAASTASTPKTTTTPYREEIANDLGQGAGGSTLQVQTSIPYGEIDGVVYMYNPASGNVIIDGVELNMTPEQYASQQRTQSTYTVKNPWAPLTTLQGVLDSIGRF